MHAQAHSENSSLMLQGNGDAESLPTMREKSPDDLIYELKMNSRALWLAARGLKGKLDDGFDLEDRDLDAVYEMAAEICIRADELHHRQ